MPRHGHIKGGGSSRKIKNKTRDGRDRMSKISKAHYSNMVLHRKCPQAWVYRYVRNLEKIEREIAPALDFGNWWHALRAADALERGREHQSIRSVPKKITTTDRGPVFDGKTVTAQEVLDASEKWWNRLQHEVQEEWLGFRSEEHTSELQSRGHHV